MKDALKRFGVSVLANETRKAISQGVDSLKKRAEEQKLMKIVQEYDRWMEIIRERKPYVDKLMRAKWRTTGEADKVLDALLSLLEEERLRLLRKVRS